MKCLLPLTYSLFESRQPLPTYVKMAGRGINNNIGRSCCLYGEISIIKNKMASLLAMSVVMF